MRLEALAPPAKDSCRPSEASCISFVSPLNENSVNSFRFIRRAESSVNDCFLSEPEFLSPKIAVAMQGSVAAFLGLNLVDI